MQMVMIISLTFSVTVVTVLDYHLKLQFHFKKGSPKNPINVAAMSL